MHDDADNPFAFDPSDPDRTYSNCRQTCEMFGVEALPRERAQGLIPERNEGLSGRREPTTQ